MTFEEIRTASIAFAKQRMYDRIQRASSDELQAAGLECLKNGDFAKADFYLQMAKRKQDQEKERA